MITSVKASNHRILIDYEVFDIRTKMRLLFVLVSFFEKQGWLCQLVFYKFNLDYIS